MAPRPSKDDVIFITVDCWRRDAPVEMPKFRSVVDSFDQSTLICNGASTNSAFPALLASNYYPNVYSADGAVEPGVVSLPDALPEPMTTGAIVASNPFLGKWSNRFDTFWNDGMTVLDADSNRSFTTAGRVKNYLTLSGRVDTTEVRQRAEAWLTRHDPPRFLWLHLMDPHGPYYPGIARARKLGLSRTYLTLLRKARRQELTPTEANFIRTLYWTSVNQFDAKLARLVDGLPDSTTVYVMADHGEELHHGHIGHARLYDEVVTTPFFTNNPDIDTELGTLRQTDVGPSILASMNVDIPEEWRGSARSDCRDAAFILNYAPKYETTYVGVRTPSAKLIRKYRDDGEVDREQYDLNSDPTETAPIDVSQRESQFETMLDEFLNDESFDGDVLESQNPGLTGAPESRLRDLGYVSQG